jgi:hypothetical protein
MIKKYIPYILLLVVGFAIGILCRPNHIREVTKMVTDTLVVIDTQIIEKPVLVEKRVVDTMLVEVHDTTRVNDTLYMRLGFETKTYQGEDYLAKVSGYNPSLYYIEVYPKTKIVKETTTQSVTNRNTLALGFEVHYSYTPYIPIYLEYSYLLHKNLEMSARIFYDIPTQHYGMGMGMRARIGW